MADVICRELELVGHQVHHAADGPGGLKAFAAQKPDLVILDWMLPGLEGLEVLRRIRQSSPVPVLMLTARSEEADRVIGLELGADDYLTKPFSMRELLARVRALLRRIEYLRESIAADRTAGRSEIEYEGVLRLDPEARSAALQGAVLDLTRTEFDLLCLLVRNPGTRSAARICSTLSGARTTSPATGR